MQPQVLRLPAVAQDDKSTLCVKGWVPVGAATILVVQSACSTAAFALQEETNLSIPTDRSRICPGRLTREAEAVGSKEVLQFRRLARVVLLFPPEFDLGKPLVKLLTSRAGDLAPGPSYFLHGGSSNKPHEPGERRYYG